jgi:hypothetical protein
MALNRSRRISTTAGTAGLSSNTRVVSSTALASAGSAAIK